MQPAILIVDDQPANLLALDAALEPLGFEIVRATSGEEAVRIAAGREFAVVLMDVRMPLDAQTLRANVGALVERWRDRQAERTALLSWLGHELRNPLAAMLTVMEVRRRKAAVIADWEETIVRQLGRLKSLAGELSRLEREGGDPPAPAHGRASEIAVIPDRPRLLLVEDNEDGQRALAELLRDSGVDVATASSAAEALQVVGDFRPDTAIVDIGLPDMDGHQLGRELRAALGTKPLRLFALSGFGTRDDQERSRAAGFDDHFVKPPELPALLRALGRGGAAG